MLKKDNLIKISRIVVRVGFIVNRLFLAAVLLGLLVSWIFPAQFTNMLIGENQFDPRSVAVGLRLMLLLGIAMSVAIDRLFVPLTQMIDSALAGDPFVSANARRLQAIGWALLILQLLDIPAVFIAKQFPALANGTPDSIFSPGGWIAVLMVFVLSRVFAAGSAMRDDLEGTV